MANDKVLFYIAVRIMIFSSVSIFNTDEKSIAGKDHLYQLYMNAFLYF